MSTYSRRRFLKGMTCAAVPFIAPARVFGAESPSNRITVGIIGAGRQSHHVNVPQFLNSSHAQIVAVCDVDAWRVEAEKARVEAHYAKRTGQSYTGCAAYRDFRDLLARDDVDAVMISSPDHWHVPMGIAAARAGKHISVEKPLSTCIRPRAPPVRHSGPPRRYLAHRLRVPVASRDVACGRVRAKRPHWPVDAHQGGRSRRFRPHRHAARDARARGTRL